MSRPTLMPCLFLIGRAVIRRQGPSWAPDDASFVNRKELLVNKLAVINLLLYGGNVHVVFYNLVPWERG